MQRTPSSELWQGRKKEVKTPKQRLSKFVLCGLPMIRMNREAWFFLLKGSNTCSCQEMSVKASSHSPDVTGAPGGHITVIIRNLFLLWVRLKHGCGCPDTFIPARTLTQGKVTASHPAYQFFIITYHGCVHFTIPGDRGNSLWVCSVMQNGDPETINPNHVITTTQKRWAWLLCKSLRQGKFDRPVTALV